MSRLFYVLLWLVLPVAVCVWAVAHGQNAPIDERQWWACSSHSMACISRSNLFAPPTHPNVPGAVLTDDVRKICRRGYSMSVRPPELISEPYKESLTRYSFGYELDHKVPLCLGGDPNSRQMFERRDVTNVWLQPIDEARAKDREEALICREVCTGQIDIHDAQWYFLNWPDGMLQ